METTTNDLGERCYAVGMEGSIARLQETYPGFLGWAELMFKEDLLQYPDRDSMDFARQVLEEFEHRNIPKEHRRILWEQTKFFKEDKIQYA
jgi:hypothetical protein